MEERRRRAVRKIDEGWSPADVAAFLDLHVETVRRWSAPAASRATTPSPDRPTPAASRS
ncbi:MAG: helix-turn-helix domain-containing protein [Planctomycetia bacterium]